MTLTKWQRLLLDEAKQIADLTEASLDSFDKIPPEYRTSRIAMVIRQLVIGDVVSQHVQIQSLIAAFTRTLN
jgi:hypothetical protein